MSSFFNCAAYDDVETTIRLDEHVVFLALEDKEKNTSIHLTLNPFQIRTLAKYLSVARKKFRRLVCPDYQRGQRLLPR